MKAQNQRHQKTIEELKRQRAVLELQSKKKDMLNVHKYFQNIFHFFFLAHILQRMKETGQYTRHINSYHQQDRVAKTEPELNGFQITRNLLTNENNSSMSSYV